MATVKVVDLLARAGTLLLDSGAVRWTRVELQNWLNDAYREAVALKPDCNTLTATFSCAEGPRQTLATDFPDAARLIEVVRNVAATSAKGAVRPTDRRSLDDARRNWYAETPSVDVQLFMFDPRLPKEFLVYPPATAAAQLEIMYAEVPTPHALTEEQLGDTLTADVIRLDDIYANALLDYVLYRAFSKDTENAANAERAVAYFGAFRDALGNIAGTAAATQPGAA